MYNIAKTLLSVSLSLYLSVYLSICLSIYLSICTRFFFFQNFDFFQFCVSICLLHSGTKCRCLSAKPPLEKIDNILQDVTTTKVVFINQYVH